MEHDASDILGQNTMFTVSGASTGLLSLSPGQYVAAAFAFIVVYFFGSKLWRRVLLWRERSYKLATRRRHGIPDSDLRPFNVAYAEAAMRAREESERPSKPKPARPQPSVVDLREESQEHVLRNRLAIPHRPNMQVQSVSIPVPGGYNEASSNTHQQTNIHYGNEGVHAPAYVGVKGIDTAAQFARAPPQPKNALTRQRGFINVQDANISPQDGDRKRPLDESMDEDEEHEYKKSRVDDDAAMDSNMDEDIPPPKRGSKRGLRDEDVEEVTSAKNVRGKRARNGVDADSSMEVDYRDEEVDEVTDLQASVRGKKRDRTEAGSTFGGDDDESVDDAGENGESKNRRRRKRRTVAKRKSEASHQRSKKRDRASSDESATDEESHTSSPNRVGLWRSKRGRRSVRGKRNNEQNDVDMGDSTSSNKPKVRSVGDEWESNGIRYKIGPNYQRLRQALVKKERQKFLMPQDSQHPDREEHLQVCIETWLTEEQYKEAKEQHMLAWQDSPIRPEHKDKLTIDIANANSSVLGKNLLWNGSTTTTPTMSPAPPSPTSEAGTVESVKTVPRSYRGQRHSIANASTAQAVPFTPTHVPSSKRIVSVSLAATSLASSVAGSPLNASTTAPQAEGLSDSTNATASPRKPFSKWEKQELEARAMLKIREANRRKEREERERLEQAEKEKERQRQERERVEREQREARERAAQEAQQKAEAEKKAEAERKAEADKKAKEAAEAAGKAAVPDITVTAPSVQPSTSGTTAGSGASSTPAAPAATGQQGFNFFAQNAGGASTAAAPSPFGAPKTAANLFAPPAPAQSAPSDASKTESKPPTISFGTPAAPAQGGSASNSLFARLGPQAPAASTEAPKPSFSFGNTTKQEPAKANPFAPSAQPAAATATATSSDPTATTTPKFNFGFAAKPAATATTNAPAKSAFGAPASSSLSGALGGSDAAPANSAFGGFKTPGAPASATNGSSATNTNPTAPKFNFGNTGASAFNTTSAFGSTAASTTTTPQSGFPAAKSAFGAPSSNTTSAPTSVFGSGTASTPSPFGAPSSNTTSAPTSVFGSGTASTPSPFGATSAQTSSVFGSGSGAATKAAEPTKPLFSFNVTGASSTPAATPAAAAAAAAPKSAFSFAPPAASSTATTTTPATTSTPAAAPAAPAFGFNFGTSATPSTTTPAASPFGAPATGASLFGGGVFGSTATNQAQKP